MDARTGHDDLAGPGPGALGGKVARGAPWVAATALSSRVLIAIVVAVLASELTAREFGLLSVALFVSTLLIMLNDLGFGHALIYQPGRIRQAAETSAFICIAAGLVAACLLVLAAPSLAEFFHVPDATWVLRAYGPMVALNAATVVPFALLSRDLDFRRRAVLETLPWFVGAVVTILLAVSGVGVWSLVIGDGTRFVMMLCLVLASPSLRVRPRWHADRARELWRYARASITATGLDFLLLNVDYILVARLLGPVALGYYSLAFRVAIMPFYGVTMVAIGATWPAMARLTSDRERLLAAFRRTVRVAMTGVVLLEGGLFLFAPSLVLLGSRWSAAVTPARLLAVFVVFRSGAALIQSLFQATGKPALNAALRGAWTGLLAISIAIAAPRFGIEGVAIVQAGLAAVMLLVHVAVARRTSGMDALGFVNDAARATMAAVVAGAVVVGLEWSVGGPPFGRSSWAGLISLSVVYVAVFGLSALWVAPSVLGDIRTFWHRFRARPVSSVPAPGR